MRKKIVSFSPISLVHKFFPNIGMDTLVDLHFHSQHSDGQLTVKENLEKLHRLDVGVVALSDHYTVAGIPEAYEYASKMNMLLIPATELSCLWKGKETHVLTYFPINALDKISELAEETLSINNNLDKVCVSALGYSLTEYDDYVYNRSEGRFKFFHFLRDKGAVKEGREATDLRLQLGGVAAFPEPDVLFKRIKQAGAIPILAHPSNCIKGSDLLPVEDLKQMVNLGIEGFECYFSYMKNPDNYKYYVDFCRTKRMLITAGSDFHGELVTPKRKLGFPLPSINRQIRVKDLLIKPEFFH